MTTSKLGIGLPTLGITSRGSLAGGAPSLGLSKRPVEPEGDEVEQAKEATKKVYTGFLARAQAEGARFESITDSEFWCCLCFETREQKQEFLAKLGLEDLGDKHLDGLQAAERLGVTLETPRAVFPKVRKTNLGNLT